MSRLSVIIRKGVAYVKRRNDETHLDEEKIKTEQILSDVLQDPITIEDTTFGQFFEFIARERDFYQKVYHSALYGHPLAPYIEEIAKPAGPVDQLKRVELYWYSDIFEGELSLSPGFHGWGTWPVDKHNPDFPTEGGIAIEYSGLNEYKDVPLVLDGQMQLDEIESGKGIKTILKAKLPFNVQDVIEAILDEITWAGDISKGRQAPFDRDYPKDEVPT